KDIVEVGPDADEQQRSDNELVKCAFLINGADLLNVIESKCPGNKRCRRLGNGAFLNFNYCGHIKRCGVYGVSSISCKSGYHQAVDFPYDDHRPACEQA